MKIVIVKASVALIVRVSAEVFVKRNFMALFFYEKFIPLFVYSHIKRDECIVRASQ